MRQRWLMAALMGMVMAVGGVGTVRAQFSFKVGMRVVTKYPTEIWIDGRFVKDDKYHRIYKVDEVKWDSIAVSSGSVEGLVPASDLLPFNEAIDYYTQDIRQHPDASRAYARRGLIRSDRDEYDLAIADYDEAIRLDPKYALAFKQRGNAWSHKGMYDRAIADYDKAIGLDPKYASAFLDRGTTWSQKREYDKAIADFEKAISLDKNYALAFNNRGVAWVNKGDTDRAFADFDRAIQIDPKYAYAYNNRGVIWSRRGEFEKAIADYSEALRLDPTYAVPYNARAWIWATCSDERFRDGKKAVVSATRACELSEWKNASYLGTLAAAYAEIGEFEKAVEYQEKAQNLYSEEDKKKWGKLLDLYKNKKPYRDEGQE